MQRFFLGIKNDKRGRNIIRGYVASNKGFTLIELLVVIAIIGTLSTIGFLALTGANDGADDAKRLAELQSIRSAATVELSKSRVYPIVDTGGEECVRLDGQLTDGSGASTLSASVADMAKQISGADLANYYYCSDAGGKNFIVGTRLKGKTPATTVVAGTRGTTAKKTITCIASAGTARPVDAGTVEAYEDLYCVGTLKP